MTEHDHNEAAKSTSNGNPVPDSFSDYLFQPVHHETWKYLFASIPKRVVGLVGKLISVKMVMFYIATFLFMTYPEYFADYVWMIVFVVTVFGREAGKIIKDIKK